MEPKLNYNPLLDSSDLQKEKGLKHEWNPPSCNHNWHIIEWRYDYTKAEVNGKETVQLYRQKAWKMFCPNCERLIENLGDLTMR